MMSRTGEIRVNLIPVMGNVAGAARAEQLKLMMCFYSTLRFTESATLRRGLARISRLWPGADVHGRRRRPRIPYVHGVLCVAQPLDREYARPPSRPSAAGTAFTLGVTVKPKLFQQKRVPEKF